MEGRVYLLNRFFNMIFNPRIYRWLIAANLLLLIWLIWISNDSLTVRCATAATVELVVLAFYYFYSPARITWDGRALAFCQYTAKRPHISRFVIVKGYLSVGRTEYSVIPTEISFHQSRIERMLDTGHISISGRATFTPKNGTERTEEGRRFVLYGIPHFASFKRDFEKK